MSPEHPDSIGYRSVAVGRGQVKLMQLGAFEFFSDQVLAHRASISESLAVDSDLNALYPAYDFTPRNNDHEKDRNYRLRQRWKIFDRQDIERLRLP